MNDEFNKEATDLLHKQIFESLRRIEQQGENLDTKISYTNGKVKRLYLLLTAVAAFSLGLGLIEAKTALSFLL